MTNVARPLDLDTHAIHIFEAGCGVLQRIDDGREHDRMFWALDSGAHEVFVRIVGGPSIGCDELAGSRRGEVAMHVDRRRRRCSSVPSDSLMSSQPRPTSITPLSLTARPETSASYGIVWGEIDARPDIVSFKNRMTGCGPFLNGHRLGRPVVIVVRHRPLGTCLDPSSFYHLYAKESPWSTKHIAEQYEGSRGIDH